MTKGRAIAIGPCLLTLFWTLALDLSSAETASAPMVAHLRAGRYAEAVASGLAAIERNSADPHAFFWLSQTLERTEGPAKTAAAAQIEERLARLLQRHPNDVYCLYGLGLVDLEQNRYPQAGERLKASISLGGDFWDVYEALVNCYQTKDDIASIAEFLEGRLKQRPRDAFLHHAIGVVHYYSSDYSAAFSSLDAARKLYREKGDRGGEGRCLLNLSDVFTYMNDYPGALRAAQGGLQVAREVGDPILEVQCLERTAFVWNDLGNDADAYGACQRASALSREMACRKLEMVCARTLGVIYLERGDLAKAQGYLSSALAYYRQTGALRSQDVCLYWLTLLHKDRGNYAEAMACSNEAVRISRRIGFKTGEAFHLTAIGDIYLSLGNYERALAYNVEALGVAERYIGKWSREECLNTIGSVYIELRDYGRSLKSFLEALAYIRKIGHRREEARCLYNVGLAYFKLGDDEKALDFFSQSLGAASHSGKRIVQAQNYNRLGDLYARRGSWDRSTDAYDRALRSGREIGQPNVIWEAYAGLGALAAARKDYAAAIEAYKKATDVIEDLRVQLLIREFSSGYFKSKIPVYEALIKLLYERHEAGDPAGSLEDCLYYAEKAKARSFLDDLQRAKIDFNPLPREKLGEVELLSRRVSHLSAGLNDASMSGAARAELLGELEKAQDDFQAFMEKVRAEHPGVSSSLYSSPCRLPEIREKLLDPWTGIIEYFVGEDNLYVFAVTADGLSVSRLTPSESRQTLRLANNYIRLLSSKEMTAADVLPAGRRLYKALLGPVAGDRLRGIKNLIVIPDRTLYYLPFEALVPKDNPDTGRGGVHFLIEDFGISYAPSASTLASLVSARDRPESPSDLLSVGDPLVDRPRKPGGSDPAGEDILYQYYLDKRFVLRRLEFASQEMDSISRLIDPASRLIVRRGEATKARVKSLPLADYKIIHFATHSLLDEKVASRSALVLTADRKSDEDGFLQAGEIYDLRLNADLVVLSACQTAGGKMENGEGIQGLARAFFCSGARSVLASLWNVNDRSTCQLMKRFYEYLAAGRTKEEALRLAKLEMSRSADWRPYNWAAFVLIGEGDAGVPLRRAPFWTRLLHF